MSTVPESIISRMVRGGSRTYFFDIKEASNGAKYLTISESKKKDNEYEKHSIMIFENDFKNFFKTLDEVRTEMRGK